MFMANRIRRLPQTLNPNTPPSLLRFHQFRFCKLLGPDGHPPPQIRTDSSADQYLRKLGMLLERGLVENARRLTKCLILRPESPFASPSDLFSSFCRRQPLLKSAFSDTLLSACADSKLPDEATQLYALIRKEGSFPSVRSFNFFLQCLVSSGQYGKALHFFTEIISSGEYRVDDFTYCKAVQSAVKLGDLNRGVDLMNHMEMPNCFIYNLLIDGFCKHKRLKEARMLFDEMLERNVATDRVTYTTLIYGCCKVGNVNEARKLLTEMLQRNIAADCFTYNTLITGFCKLGDVKEAHKLLNEMLETKITPDSVTYNALIYGNCKVGNLSGALNFFEKMKADNLRPNLVTYNTLIDKCCKLGNLNVALNFCETMKAENLKPDVFTYNTLIDGYCKLGNLNEALNVYEKMKVENVQPDLVTYRSMLGGLSCSKDKEDAWKLLQKAKELFDDLKARVLSPGVDSYIKLINGHCQIGDFDGGYVWYCKMRQNGLLPDQNTCNALVIGLRNALVTGLRKLSRLEEKEIISSEMSNVKGSMKK